MVEPPPGFLEKAVDRRPLFALRGTVALLCGATLALFGVTQIGGLDRHEVLPPVDDLIERHATAEVAMHDGTLEADETLVRGDDEDSPPLSLPGSLQQQGRIEGSDPDQMLYADDDDAVSVFSQPGRVDWEELPRDGMETLGGVPAWVDSEQELVLVESADAAVTIVGLSPAELVGPLQTLPRRSRGAAAWLRETASAISAQLGFADLD
ncbi:MAG: hypothetical protein O3C27_00680 [Actinomycetota bacterium]|nr:hypothetical protein [Actinomycetota bacterium]